MRSGPDTAEAVAVRRRAREVCPAADVDRAIGRMAGEIGASIASSDPLVLAVMSGGVFTATAMCRHFDFPYRFDYVHLTRYGAALAGGDIEWHVPPPERARGRSVVVVDDVLDRGVTLAALVGALRELEVAELRVAVLARKAVETDTPRPAVDAVGIETGDEYLFGCGMDYKGYWRGLPALYAVADS